MEQGATVHPWRTSWALTFFLEHGKVKSWLNLDSECLTLAPLHATSKASHISVRKSHYRQILISSSTINLLSLFQAALEPWAGWQGDWAAPMCDSHSPLMSAGQTSLILSSSWDPAVNSNPRYSFLITVAFFFFISFNKYQLLTETQTPGWIPAAGWKLLSASEKWLVWRRKQLVLYFLCTPNNRQLFLP